MVDDPDPIQVGEVTTYTIKVTNQGFADIHNVKVVYTSGERTSPVSSPQGTVSGKDVNFPAVASLAAKQVVTYTIAVKGLTVGDSRNKVVLTSDELRVRLKKPKAPRFTKPQLTRGWQVARPASLFN